MQSKMTIDKLSRMYTEADTVDKEIFAEQRSNVQLVSGDHYSKKTKKYWSRLRDMKEISDDVKVRLTKNHTQKITKIYANSIFTYSPSVGVSPANPKELRDQKAAEINHAVWEDLRKKNNLRQRTREWISEFVDIGEVFTKIYFNPYKGEYLEGVQEFAEDGSPLFDEQGEPIVHSRFRGGIDYERVYAFNLLRDPQAKSLDDARWMCIRKMVNTKELKEKVKGDKEKEKLVADSRDETYVVFDANSSTYQKQDGMCMLKEFYFRPCVEYPKGYFFICTEQGILWEGELPFGIFPIVYAGFDHIPTSARARSIIKQIRPLQAEVNRAASTIVQHHLTLGDDKVLIQSGTKISQGQILPGVRSINYSGMAPTILSGRTAEGYLNYMQSQITEMYAIAGVKEIEEEKQSNMEAYRLLYTSLREKKKFQLYSDKIEAFLTEVCRVSLELAKKYYDDDQLIYIIGKGEAVNIAEFRNTDPLCYQIKLEPQTDDVETKLGRMITAQTFLQYVGKDMSKTDVGRLLRSSPYANNEEPASDATIDFDNATNDILALDRGEYRPAQPYDDHPYVIRRLTHRMRLEDYKYLPEEIRAMYEQKVDEHNQLEAERQKQIMLAKSELIPSGGPLVACDFYVNDPKTGAVKRAKLPQQTLNWVIEKLEAQGMAQEQLEQMNQGALADLSKYLVDQAQVGVQNPMDQGVSLS